MKNHAKPLAIVITLVLWASAFVGIRAGLREYSPFHLALLRYGAASLVLLVIVLFKRIRIPEYKDLFHLVLTGSFGIGLYNIALNYGEKTVTASSASFIVGTAPIMTAVLSVFILKERVNIIGWIGMVVSFAGVSLISFGESASLSFEKGALIILVAAITQSVYFIAQKPLLKKYSSFEVTTYSIWAGTIVLLPFIKGLFSAIHSVSIGSTLAVVYLGVFPGVIAYFCWSYVLSKFPASKASSFLYFVPVITIIIGFIWLKEIPKSTALIGGFIAITGVIITNKSSYIKNKIIPRREKENIHLNK